MKDTDAFMCGLLDRLREEHPDWPVIREAILAVATSAASTNTSAPPGAVLTAA